MYSFVLVNTFIINPVIIRNKFQLWSHHSAIVTRHNVGHSLGLTDNYAPLLLCENMSEWSPDHLAPGGARDTPPSRASLSPPGGICWRTEAELDMVLDITPVSVVTTLVMSAILALYML